MPKIRKTKKEKIRAEQRKAEVAQFTVKDEWLNTNTKKTVASTILNREGKKYFKLDLTKTFFLTMLVVALELALWQYLSKH